MFKIDWPCAIGGALVGYYAKGKVVAAKATIKKISTDAMASIKESFSEESTQAAAQQKVSEITQNMQQQFQGANGQNPNGH